jgi:hypothetical protein
MGVLTTAKHVEVAKAYCLETVVPVILFSPFLIAALAESIRRKQIAFYTFLLGEVSLVAIDG